MAQLVEQRIRNAWVGGSSPPIGSTLIKFLPILVQRIIAVIAQLVEHWLPKPRVAGSSPVYRSLMKNKFLFWAVVALMTTINAQAQEENNKGDRPRETYLTEATRPRGWMMAFVLSNVAPERTEPLMNYARQFALNRVIMGRHWKSDIDAGLMLAAALFSDITACEAYQKQLIKAKTEYEALR